MTARIRLEKEGPVGRVHLARANRGNALDPVMAAGVVTDVESRATPEYQDGVRRPASQEGGS